ncbi:MAG: pyruvate carboxyltransferase [Nitrososphaeria archaeon]
MSTGGLYRGEDHFVSFYDFEALEDLKGKVPDRVEVHDVTLRDGEQQAGVIFTKDDKVRIARALAEAGVDRIEAGMPTVSDQDFHAVREIAHLRLGPKIYSFARCMNADVDRALDADVDGVVMEIPSSDHLIERGYGWTVDRAIELSISATRYAHDHGLRVVFFTIDATRSPFDTFWSIVGRVAKEGYMDSLTVADTFGVLSPQGTVRFIERVRSVVDKPVEIHAHNDFGLGVANTVAAVLGGASTVHVSVNGIGERSGNTSLEETVMALRYLYGIRTGVRTERLRELSKLVSELSRVSVPPQKAIVGDNLFTVESGIIVGWYRRLAERGDLLEMFPYKPSVVGQEGVKIAIGKKSGMDTIYYMAEKMGVKLSEDEAMRVLRAVKEVSLARKGLLNEEELAALIRLIKPQ